MKKQTSLLIAVIVLFLLVPFSVNAQLEFGRQIISEPHIGARSMHPIDFDKDGDKDIAGASWYDDCVIWLENDGNENFTAHIIDDDFDGSWRVYALDMEPDGDFDLFGAAYNDSEIAWWENDGDMNFTKHTVETGFSGARCVFAQDSNSDGDVEIFGASFFGDEFSYWDESEDFNIQHNIETNYGGTSTIYTYDLDNDMDLDIMGTAHFPGNISWFERTGNFQFERHEIISDFDGANNVYAADIDGDGDNDLVGSAVYSHQIRWWENDGNMNFTQHILVDYAYRPSFVQAGDIDNDDDIDIFASIYGEDRILWWENDGDANFTQHEFSNSIEGITCVILDDLDEDGDLDVMGAASEGHYFVWWENGLINDNNNGQVTFRMDATLAIPGDQYELPVYLEGDIYTQAVTSIDFLLNLPVDNIAIVDLFPAEGHTITDDSWTHSWDVSGSNLSFSASGTTPVAESGILCYVVVEILDNAPVGNSEPIIFESASINTISENVITIDGQLLYSTGYYGDVSGDGVLEIHDASMIMDYVAYGGNWEVIQQIIGDVSGNGEISILDAALILAYLDGQIEAYPVETGEAHPEGHAEIFSDNEIELETMNDFNYPVTIMNVEDMRSLSLKIEYPFDVFELQSVTSGEVTITRVVADEDGSTIYIAFEEMIDNVHVSLDLNFSIISPFVEQLISCTSARVNEGEEFDFLERTEIILTDAVEDNSEIPLTHGLSKIYPNPFNPETTISIDLERLAPIRIDVYNMLGQRVTQLANGQFNAGRKYFIWNASAYPSGQYIMNIIVDHQPVVKTVTLLK